MSAIELSRKVKDWVSANQAKWLIDLLASESDGWVPRIVPQQRKYAVVVVTSGGDGHVLIESFKTHPGEHATSPILVEREFPQGLWKFALRSTYSQVNMTLKEER